METLMPRGATRFRVWIATYDDWLPVAWNQVPPVAMACEPVESGLYTEAEAALFVEGFNRSMLAEPRQIWAVAVPITIRYDGDAQPGLPIHGHIFPAEEATAPMSIVGPIVGNSAPGDLEPGQHQRGDRERGDHSQGLGQSPQRSR